MHSYITEFFTKPAKHFCTLLYIMYFFVILLFFVLQYHAKVLGSCENMNVNGWYGPHKALISTSYSLSRIT